MKKIIYSIVVTLFVTQTTLALPASHQIHAQLMEVAVLTENDAIIAENNSKQIETEFGTDARWVQRLEHKLQTKGLKRFEKRLNRELEQDTKLTDAEKAATFAAAHDQAVAAIPQIVAKARAAGNPFALLKVLKRDLREAKEQQRQQQNPSSSGETSKLGKQQQDRQPAQVRVSIRLSWPLAVALAIVALYLVLLCLGALIATLSVVLLPAACVFVVVAIVI